MASAFSGLARALAARSAAVPRTAGFARPALAVRVPAFVVGARCISYSKGELERRRRTLVLTNIPWEMSDEDVQLKVEGYGGFTSIEPSQDTKGKFTVTFLDANRMHRARKHLSGQFWHGRNVVAYSEHTRREDPGPPAPCPTLHIRNIPRSASDEAMTRLFRGMPGHPKISVPRSRQWLGYIGYAKLDFASTEEATVALERLRGRKVGEVEIECDYSYPLAPGHKFARSTGERDDRQRSNNREGGGREGGERDGVGREEGGREEGGREEGHREGADREGSGPREGE